ncbi:MAG: hypothetical protein MRK02_01545 [Candidatus Scalindua sp.]|nr:hypothetical protein [Candidatus Scalindua sp.]
MLKIIFLITVLVNLVFFSFLHRVAVALERHEQEREDIVIRELVVNNDNKYRTVICKNEEEGIKELRSLVDTSRIEECWIFLPPEERWVEIGSGAVPETRVDDHFITKVGVDVQFMESVMAKNNSLIVYHIHPTYSLFLEHQMRKCRENGQPMKEKEVKKARTEFLIKRAYPSGQDLGNMIENTMEFIKKNPGGNIMFKICSHYGITECYLTKEGKIYFICDNYPDLFEKIVRICMKMHRDAALAVENYEQKIRKKVNLLYRIKMHSKQKKRSFLRANNGSKFEIDPFTLINKAFEAMSSDYLKVAFTPYTQRE